MNFLILLLLGTLSSAAIAESQQAVVIVPVADVWSRPLALGEKPADDLRETQVLSGEKVLIHESSGSWVRIEAIEQPEFTHHQFWEGYPGWVSANALGQSKKDGVVPGDLHPSTHRSPTEIVKYTEGFYDTPYLWGGLTKESGIDCSGLTHLAFRTNGMQIPRDSYDQWMKAKPIKRSELKRADLIFSAKEEDPKKITHVALYAGDGMIIEAPQTGVAVRKISFKEKYGKALAEVESGDHVGERFVYFGSFLH